MKGADYCSLYREIHYYEVHYNKIWVYIENLSISYIRWNKLKSISILNLNSLQKEMQKLSISNALSLSNSIENRKSLTLNLLPFIDKTKIPLRSLISLNDFMHLVA